LPQYKKEKAPVIWSFFPLFYFLFTGLFALMPMLWFGRDISEKSIVHKIASDDEKQI
jgi:hypothetical protein